MNTDIRPTSQRKFLSIVLLLVLVLSILFSRSFDSDYVVFSNDAPLGGLVAHQNLMPEILSGLWADLNWIGSPSPTPPLAISSAFRLITSPLLYAKVAAPCSLFFLGLSAWFCFRQFRFAPVACVLGGLAATLNSEFFATACWGVCQQPVAFGLAYLALGALADTASPRRWIRVVLAGFAVGLAVTEAYDIGALFSLAVAAFVVAQALAGEGGPAKRIASGFGRLAVVAVFAGFIAAATLSTLIGTQIKGVVGMGQDAEAKTARWHQATQWSLPKSEVLGLLVPNFFGCRMDTPAGGAYWGACGQDAAWTEYLAAGKQDGPVPGGFFRYGGGSTYVGMLVLVVAAWAGAQSLRGGKSFFSKAQRRLIWFWLGVIFVSALLMFGRFAPFYQFFYALPYASTIRNPGKFLHIVEWALIIVFAYGMHGLATLYLNPAAATGRDLVVHVSAWWRRVTGFERQWAKASFWAVIGAGLAWLVFFALRGSLVAYVAGLNRLQQLQAGQPPDLSAAEAAAQATANFSLGQAGWAVVALGVTVGLLTLVVSGYFNGPRTRAAGIALGLLVAVDLGWQNRPYVVVQNWREKYESNSIVDFLRERPYEQRVAIFPLERFVDLRQLPREAQPVVQHFQFFSRLYGSEWTQHLFQYYNVQTLDIIQEPRTPTDKAAYESVMYSAPPLRRWELTNTRYLLGPTAFLELLNQQLDAGKSRFRIAKLFNLAAKPDADPAGPRGEQITTAIATNGALAVFDFTGALPRAKLYAQWKVSTNEPTQLRAWAKTIQARVPPEWATALAAQTDADLATLHDLADPAFDPAQTVLLSEPLSVAPGTNQNPGEVKFASYAPKHIVLQAQTAVPAVLLLNDKYDPNWQVTVDGQPAALLRCNYLMRGVQIPKGEHRVEFHFRPPLNGFYVSLAALALGGVLLMVAVFWKRD